MRHVYADVPSSWQNAFLMGRKPGKLPAQAAQSQACDPVAPEGFPPPLEARTSQGSTTSFSHSTSAPLLTPSRSEPPPGDPPGTVTPPPPPPPRFPSHSEPPLDPPRCNGSTVAPVGELGWGPDLEWQAHCSTQPDQPDRFSPPPNHPQARHSLVPDGWAALRWV